MYMYCVGVVLSSHCSDVLAQIVDLSQFGIQTWNVLMVAAGYPSATQVHQWAMVPALKFLQLNVVSVGA